MPSAENRDDAVSVAEVPKEEEPGVGVKCDLKCSSFRCCLLLGPLGLREQQLNPQQRRYVLWTVMILLSIGCLFILVACFGISEDSAIIKSCQWANYETDEFSIYVNLAAARIDNRTSGESHVFLYDDIDWAKLGVNTQAQKCTDAGAAAYSQIVLQTVLRPLGVFAAFKRMNNDTNWKKWEPMMTLCINFIFMSMCVGKFTNECWRYLDDDANLGYSWYMCASCLLIDIICFVLHGLLAAPEYSGPTNPPWCCVWLQKVCFFFCINCGFNEEAKSTDRLFTCGDDDIEAAQGEPCDAPPSMQAPGTKLEMNLVVNDIIDENHPEMGKSNEQRSPKWHAGKVIANKHARDDDLVTV